MEGIGYRVPDASSAAVPAIRHGPRIAKPPIDTHLTPMTEMMTIPLMTLMTLNRKFRLSRQSGSLIERMGKMLHPCPAALEHLLYWGYNRCPL